MISDAAGSGGHFTPSTIRGSSNKLLKAFYQHINTKIEVIIYSDWARKPGKKRRTESQQTRFVVATTSSLYICKPGVITSVKIAQLFHWITIKTFSVDADTHEITLSFNIGSSPPIQANSNLSSEECGNNKGSRKSIGIKSSPSNKSETDRSTITLIIDDYITFTEKCVSYLRSILPLYYPLKISIPLELFNSTTAFPSAPAQIVDLYISQCKAMNENIDITDITMMKHDIHHGKPFVIDRSLQTENQVDAMCKALMYSPLIKKARIGGKNFDQLFSKIGQIISLNMGLQELEIFKCKMSSTAKSQFEYFLRMMHRSSIQSLTLNEVPLNGKNAELLATHLLSMQITSLTFDDCQFGKNILLLFHRTIREASSKNDNADKNKKTETNIGNANEKNSKEKPISDQTNNSNDDDDSDYYSDSYSSNKDVNVDNDFASSYGCSKFDVQDLIIKDDMIVSLPQVSQIINLCVLSSLTTLVLVECQLDITNFFESMNETLSICNNNNISEPIKLISIDLSRNKCSSSFTGEYILPTKLEELRLRKIIWEGDSLVNFLKNQKFVSWVDLDLSKCCLSDLQITNFLKKSPSKPPSLFIRSFKWNGNPIFVKFLEFLTEFKFLQIISLNNCNFPKNDKETILSTLANLVSRTNLQWLSIDKTMSPFGSKTLRILKDVLCHHQTIKRIDISDDSIGDDGLSILKEIVTVNTRISQISFDGCEVSDYSYLVSFLSYIAQLPYLTAIGKPKKEMNRLCEKFGKKVKKDLKVVWGKITEKHQVTIISSGKSFATIDTLNENDDDDNFIYNIALKASGDISSTTSALISSAANDSSASIGGPGSESDASSFANKPEMTLLETNWDIQIDIQADGGADEWDQLRYRYSFANLTGLEALRPKNTENDLIQFETV
ncbi:hypothetical protein M9Y10_040943 [Tritrichomonas musculus]|uniref:Leucine Rich Repeat family protein n=1 Tax=Tritrichomonas musculus TaxID=1915356 RepID=A0ABR2K305_9EUKA